jgi:pimeloyl-ACP methyl ester carboxylesterase
MKHLLLLHGALGHSNQFEPYEAWLSRHFTIHKILFRGHGGSDIPGDGISIGLYIDQVHRYCEEHRLEEVSVFGYSMGGYVALAYALQQPGRINSILTLATKLDWTKEGAAKESKMLNPDIIAEKVPKYAAQLASQHGTEHWKLLLPAIAGMMISLGDAPLLNEGNLGTLRIPVQLMVGDKDVMVSIEETGAAARSITDGRLAVLPHTKHPLEQVRPELLKHLMADFWNL